jgi:hypothetical protein
MSNVNFQDDLPARLDVSQTAKLLGFAPHDIPVLTAAKMLDALGTPASNAPKYYARVIVMEHANDPKWLDKTTRVIGRYWQTKRARRNDASVAKSDG